MLPDVPISPANIHHHHQEQFSVIEWTPPTCDNIFGHSGKLFDWVHSRLPQQGNKLFHRMTNHPHVNYSIKNWLDGVEFKWKDKQSVINNSFQLLTDILFFNWFGGLNTRAFGPLTPAIPIVRTNSYGYEIAHKWRDSKNNIYWSFIIVIYYNSIGLCQKVPFRRSLPYF